MMPLSGNSLMTAVVPPTRMAAAAASDGTNHLLRDFVLMVAKMTPPTIAPSTTPISVLLFSA